MGFALSMRSVQWAESEGLAMSVSLVSVIGGVMLCMWSAGVNWVRIVGGVSLMRVRTMVEGSAVVVEVSVEEVVMIVPCDWDSLVVCFE